MSDRAQSKYADADSDNQAAPKALTRTPND